MAYMPIAFITAQTGRNVKAMLNLAQSLFKQASKRVGTGTLNRVLREAVEAHPPAMRENKTPKIYYATQVGTAPPTVVLFVNHPSLFDATYQRYLLHVFRDKLPFHDIPIKLYLRARTQTDPNAPRAVDPEDRAADLGSRLDSDLSDPELATADHGSYRQLDVEVNDLLSELEE
jgi:GTP-binding protein